MNDELDKMEALKQRIQDVIDSPALHTGEQPVRNFVVLFDTKQKTITVRDDEDQVFKEAPYQLPTSGSCLRIFSACQTMKAFLPDWEIRIDIEVVVH